VLHSGILSQHDRHTHTHRDTHTLIHSHKHTYKDARPKTRPKTRHTHITTHTHTRTTVSNKQIRTDTYKHAHTHTLSHNMRAFVIDVSEGLADFCNHRYQTYSHPHYLRASTASSCTPHPLLHFQHPPTCTGGRPKNSSNGWLWRENSGPQDLYNVYLPS